jgi:RHS repeat-associated protein
VGQASRLTRFEYTLNAAGNRTAKSQVGTSGPLVRSESYTYDAVDQLTNAIYAVAAVTNRIVSYDYDPVGNRENVTDNGTNTGYAANHLNQYTAVGFEAPTHDANGNLTGINGWTYTYDAQNRLISAVGGPSSVAASFFYDARNRCIKRVLNGTTTYLIYDGWSLIEERDAGDNLHAKYIHGAVIDEILVRYNGSPVWYHHDGLGGTTHVTDNTGTVIESYTYDVYGAPAFFGASGSLLSASALSNRFLFTGREWLAEVELYDYRYRLYSPLTGRFLTVDPIRFSAEDANLYRYVEGSVATYTDPYGLDGVFIRWSRPLQRIRAGQWAEAIAEIAQIAQGVPDPAKGTPLVDPLAGKAQAPSAPGARTPAAPVPPTCPKPQTTVRPRNYGGATFRGPLGVVGPVLQLIPGLLEDWDRFDRARNNGISFQNQLREDYRNAGEYLMTPFGPVPNAWNRYRTIDG